MAHLKLDVRTIWSGSWISANSSTSGHQIRWWVLQGVLLAIVWLLGRASDHGGLYSEDCHLKRFRICSSFADTWISATFFHFSKRLRPEFEVLRGSMLHQSPIHNIIDVVCEFSTEEETCHRLLSLVQSTTTTVLFASHPSGVSASWPTEEKY